MKKRKRKIALSIDIDFFFRELFEWDFGHSENSGLFASDLIWHYRYAAHDILKESNIEKYADCLPDDLFFMLLKKGFKILSAQVGAGWSHKNAYDFFRPLKFDTLINLDAHHDCYGGSDEVNCGNWVLKLLQEKPRIQYHWVFPKFLKKTFGIKTPEEVFEKLSFEDLGRDAGQVVAIYIAQSPAWTPPHFDPYFFRLIQIAKIHAGKERFKDYKMVKREDWPEEKIQKVFEEGRKQRETIEAFYKTKGGK